MTTFTDLLCHGLIWRSAWHLARSQMRCTWEFITGVVCPSSIYITFTILPFPRTIKSNHFHILDQTSFNMDFVNKFTGGDSSQQQGEAQNQQQQNTSNQQNQSGGGLFSGLGDRLNSAAGGGRESEKNEDMLDKGTQFQDFIYTSSSLDIILIIKQVSISCKRSSWVKELRTMSRRSSKRKMSRSRIISGSSTRAWLARMFPLRIRRRDSAKSFRYTTQCTSEIRWLSCSYFMFGLRTYWLWIICKKVGHACLAHPYYSPSRLWWSLLPVSLCHVR